MQYSVLKYHKMSSQISSKNTVICLTVVDTSSTMLSMRKLKHGK